MEDTIDVWWCELHQVTGFEPHCPEQNKVIGFVTFVRNDV